MAIDTLTPSRLAERLLRLVTARAEAVATLEAATSAVVAAKHALTLAETGVWLNGALDGITPAEKRERKLWAECYAEHGAVQTAERDHRQARAQLEQIDAELSVLKALGRLVGGEA